MNTNDWNQAAAVKYLSAHPQLQEEVGGLSLEEQHQQAQWAMEDEAEEKGLEAWEYALQWLADTPEQLQAMRLEAHRQVAEALGMAWDEYRELNDIEG